MANSLRRLIALEGLYQELVKDAREERRELENQEPKPNAIVRRADVDRALGLYQEGHLTTEQLQEWASLLEMNEYLEYEHGFEGTVADVLFRLSTPEINEPISHAVVRNMRDCLGDSKARG